MGLIATRSLTREIPGINDLVAEAEDRIRSGLIAWDALRTIRTERAATPDDVRATFEAHGGDLGYAMLLLRYTDDPRMATEAQITQAAWDTVPSVGPMFWSFRAMVAAGFAMLVFLAYAFWTTNFRGGRYPAWFLRAAVLMIPVPWLACELGWFVAEFGRQPWTVEGLLPTFVSASRLSVLDLLITLTGFVALYTALLVIEVRLMLAAIRKGPVQDVAETEIWLDAHQARLSGPVTQPAE